jgi:adenosyl cobinamide kinase/adenosyl cobinamide phosphate guanylyltransferase
MNSKTKTTVGATAIGAAVNTIVVFVENKLGVGITPEVAAAQGVVFVAAFGRVFPL